MDIHVSKIVGKMGEGMWGQIHDFTPEDEIKALHKGRLIAVVSRSVSWRSGDAGSLQVIEEGREILARLHEIYFGAPIGEGEGLLGIKGAVNQLHNEFPEVEAEIVVIVGEVVYVVVLRGGVWIKSGDKEGFLVPPTEDGETVGFSARIDGDKMLVLGNSPWWNKVSMISIKSLADSGDIEGGMEELAAIMHGEEKSGGEVGAIINFQFSITNFQTSSKQQALRQEKKEEIIRPKVWEKVKGRLPKINIKKKEGPVYVNYEDRGKKRKRTRIVAAGFAVLLLIIGLGGRMKAADKNKREGETNKIIEEMVYKFREAKGVAELNPTRSRQLLETVTSQLATLKEKNVKDERLAEVESELGEVLGLATGIKKTEPVELLDLGLVRDGMVGNEIAISEGKLFVADKNSNRLALIDPVKKSGKILAGEEGVGKISRIAGYPGKVVALSDKGIVECVVDPSKPDKQCSMKVERDESWGQIADMKMFAGNIYLLDNEGGNIWKHQGNGESFGKKQVWLAADTDKSAIKFAKSMAIDGSIWLVGGEGVLLKISSGVKEDFNVSGWDKPWGGNVLVYTDDLVTKLYVLDKDNGRVVVIKKTGEYEMQLVSESLNNMEGMVVSETDKKIYLVGQAKIWEISL